MNLNKTLFKTLAVLAVGIVLALFVVGIVQSVELNSLQQKQSQLEVECAEMEQKLQKAEQDVEYKQSKDYYTDYHMQEEQYVHEGEKIIEIEK